MTIDEQVENLKSIGLIVDDDKYAKKILNDISYFRLVKAYSLNLKSKNGNYNKQITFKEIVDLYLFNANFRQIIFPEIEKIEINVRCRLANFFAEQYGVLGYLKSENFDDERYHSDFLSDINEEIRRNSRAPFVRNFRENYEGGNLPIYALVEVFSFGTLSKFYKNMHNKDKKAIAKTFGKIYFKTKLLCYTIFIETKKLRNRHKYLLQNYIILYKRTKVSNGKHNLQEG